MVNDDYKVPSAWTAYMPILAGLFRAVLAALGAAGFTWASAVTGSQVEMAAGAAMMVAAALWSAWQKVRAVQAARRQAIASAQASATASAARGEPVPVVVTGVGS